MSADEIVDRNLVPILGAIVLILAMLLVFSFARYQAVQDQLAVACGPDSVVARLDLTEWVGLCRT